MRLFLQFSLLVNSGSGQSPLDNPHGIPDIFPLTNGYYYLNVNKLANYINLGLGGPWLGLKQG